MLQHVQSKDGFTLNAQLLSWITALTTSQCSEGEHDAPHQAGQCQCSAAAPRAQALPNCQKLWFRDCWHGPQTLSWSPAEHTPDCSSISPNSAFQRAEGLFAVETLNQYPGTKESSNANRSSIQTWNPGNILLASKTPSVTHSPMKRAVSEVIFIYNVFVPCLFGKWRTSWRRWHLSELPFHTRSIQTPKVWASQGSYWAAHIYLHQKYITCLLWKCSVSLSL